MNELVFLKLGGSLITDKARPYTVRAETLTELAGQIAAALRERPGMRLLLGHGSGSFGHTAARDHRTREGLKGIENNRYWRGFAEVGHQAALLNRQVMDALRAADLPAISLPPSAAVTARDGLVARWDLGPLRSALVAGLLPVVYGDVVLDEARGGTILSTEELFAHLACALRPGRILIAGIEEGVWADFPGRTKLVSVIDGSSDIRAGASEATDVTGGMGEKVRLMLELCAEIDGLQARIFSGQGQQAVFRALRGEALGTLIRV